MLVPEAPYGKFFVGLVLVLMIIFAGNFLLMALALSTSIHPW